MFYIIVMAGLKYDPEKRIDKETGINDIQKLPVRIVPAPMRGIAARAPSIQINELVLWYFFEYLSPIIPPSITEENPSVVKLIALAIEY